jgi:FdhD protein
MIQPPVRSVARTAFRGDAVTCGMRSIPEETPVAFSYNRTAYAVMLATPADQEDFATWFSLTEGTIQTADEIEELDVVAAEHGIELRIWLAPQRADKIAMRQRRLAGPSGCGLCGLESLVDAARALSHITSAAGFDAAAIHTAMAALPTAQKLNQQTHAIHAAAFWHSTRGLVAAREDVGRHNALDKLAGALARDGAAVAEGLLLLSSRISVEMVQKSAMLGAPVVVAVSAPTAHGGSRRHHADRHSARRRLRGLHPSRAYRRATGATCRLTSSPTWPTRSAGSSRTNRTTRRLQRSPTTSRISGTQDAQRDSRTCPGCEARPICSRGGRTIT